jgi:hypothetical protein
VPEVSDLDLLLALHDEPTDGDRAAASRLKNDLDARFPQINGVGILLYSTATLLSDLERNDLGWFVACLCTPLIGEDLAARLPRYRPTSLLARETNGDLGAFSPTGVTHSGRLGQAPASTCSEGASDRRQPPRAQKGRRPVPRQDRIHPGLPRWGRVDQRPGRVRDRLWPLLPRPPEPDAGSGRSRPHSNGG